MLWKIISKKHTGNLMVMMMNNQVNRMMTELIEQHQNRIKYLENKILEYEAEINQLKYFIKKEKTSS